MAREIERKFLLANEDWRQEVSNSRALRQAYLSRTDRMTLRIRLVGDSGGRLTIKSGKTGFSRDEYEYDIPFADAEELLRLRQGAVIEKTRYEVRRDRHVWEIDVFEGENAGLVMAEIELQHEDESFDCPDWLGREVTGDTRYYNAYLSETPFSSWDDG